MSGHSDSPLLKYRKNPKRLKPARCTGRCHKQSPSSRNLRRGASMVLETKHRNQEHLTNRPFSICSIVLQGMLSCKRKITSVLQLSCNMSLVHSVWNRHETFGEKKHLSMMESNHSNSQRETTTIQKMFQRPNWKLSIEKKNVFVCHSIHSHPFTAPSTRKPDQGISILLCGRLAVAQVWLCRHICCK